VRNKTGTATTLDRLSLVGDVCCDRGKHRSKWGSRLIGSRGMKWMGQDSVNERREYIARASGCDLKVKMGAGWGTRDLGVELREIELKNDVITSSS